MEMVELLVEQRRIGDEFRSVEKTVLKFKDLLAGSAPTEPDRAEAEAMLRSSCSELMRLGLKRLELDASVSRAAARR